MAQPKFSDFKTWVGKALSKSQWDFNLNTIIGYLTDGTADLTAGTVTATHYGDGSNLTGISSGSGGGSGTGGFLLGDKYLYAPKNFVSQAIVPGVSTVTQISCFLNVDAGVQIDSMNAPGAWTTTNADCAGTLTTNTTYFVEGDASLGINKTGTAADNAGLKCTGLNTTNLTNKKLRATVFVPTITSGSLVNVRGWIGSDTSFANYKYYNITTDVNNSTILANNNYYTIEMNPAAGGDGSGGSYGITSTIAARFDLNLSSAGATFNNFCVDHLVATPDTSPLVVNVYKKCATGDLLICQTGQTCTFGGVTAGAVTSISTSFQNNSLSTNDILYFNLPSTGTYPGQDITVYIKA